MSSIRTLRPAAVAIVLLSVVLGATPAHAVRIEIRSADGATDGFNDPTPVSPVGRNPGKTLGAQRRYVFQYAADKWGLRLKGSVPIIVGAGFASLPSDANGTLLGFARTTTVHRDFPGVPVAGTWYVAPLANQFAGVDQNNLIPDDCGATLVDGKCPEIESRFNSAVDEEDTLGERSFYYGVDGNSGLDVDFLSVVLHEIAHGLGVLSLVEPFSGQEFYGFDDAYSANLEDKDINPRQVSQMSNLQRQKAVVDDGALVWAGAEARAESSTLTDGTRGDGGIRIFAPQTYLSGSSVSHLDVQVAPNELMEPYINTPAAHSLEITLAMLRDIGWKTNPMPECGDANGDGNITTADALIELKAAVGTGACAAVICDVNVPGGVTASDALFVLKTSVGQYVTLSCPEG